MCEVIINGELKSEVNNLSTVNEVIDFYLTKMENSFVSEVLLNNKATQISSEGLVDHTLLNDISKVELTILSKIELAYDAINSSSQYIDLITKQIDHLLSLFEKNEISEGNVLLADTVELIDLFIQLMGKIKKTLGVKAAHIVNMKEYEAHLLSVLKAMLTAREKDDLVMLSDLLEYELKDNLTQWKIKIIPQFKNLKSV